MTANMVRRIQNDRDRVRTETFGADWPASARVGVSDLLLGAKLEVDAVAVVSA
jgi:hypothetical protein